MSFKRFDAEDLVVSAEAITSPLWTGEVTTLQQFYTSSTQVQVSSTGDYFIQVYQTASSLSTAEIQFSIAYCDKVGSGSNPYNAGIVGNTPSRTNYGQYRSLILGDEDSNFLFGDHQADYFYALNIDRNRYKERLLPGTLNLKIGDLTLTDDSNMVNTITYNDAGRVYQLISGSLGTAYSGTGYTTSSGSYGMLLPDIGVVLLNGKALDQNNTEGVNLNTSRASTVANNYINPEQLLTKIVSGSSFRLNSEETISSQFVFVRARNGEFNYSVNPSNITGSGDLRHTVMVNSPETYITTVGLYNDNNDLLAVAKLSTPLKKNFTKEALIRIKLDF
jgi:hypothetical protein